MILKPTTTLFVVNKSDGSVARMTVQGYHNALNGGLNPETVVITTCNSEADELHKKHEAIARVVAMLEGLNFAACQRAADLIGNRLHELA